MAVRPRTETADGGVPHPSLRDCLAFVAHVHGRDTALADALAGAEQTAAATSSADLLRMARAAGLRSRRLRLRWADLPRLARHLPAIVPLADGSHLILTAIREDAGRVLAMVHDPRGGAAEPVAIDRVRFERVWTGTVLLVRSGQRSRGADRPFGWRAIAGVLLQEPRLLRDALAATLALAALAAVPILFVQLLLLRVLPYKADRSLLVLSIGLVVAVVVEAAFGALRGYLVSRLAARAQARLTTQLFDRLLGLPVDAVQARPVGESRQTFGGLRAIETALTTLLPVLALDAGVLIVLLPLLAYLDMTLAAVVVVLGSLAAALLVMALPRLRRAGERSAAAQAARDAFLVQSLAGMAAVKALARAPSRIRQWDRLTAMVGKARLDEARVGDRIAALALPAERVLVVGMLALGIGLAALRAEPAQVAPLVAFTLLMQRLLAPLPALAGMARAQGAARAAVRSLGAFVNQPAERGAAPHDSAAVTRGAIVLDRVRFRYPGAANLALRGVSFTVEPGTTLGIMGKSGAGKTTIARLLQRLQTAQEGTIRIDGADLVDVDPRRLRRAVAVVPQTSVLFAGTIRDTITAAKPDASFEEMTLAAHRAGADEFIDRLPRGYETRLDEGAPALSGGQRQRLALARALITAPKILILDEALSALDAEIEATVEARLREARKGLTTIVISHRLSALMACDKILVMADGEVRDIGRHADLLERCELYSAAWSRQQGAIEGDAPLGDGLLALS